MHTTTSYLARVQPAIDEVGERLAALAAAASDPDVRLARSDWTVRQATAHLVTVVPRYADGPEGRGTWVADRQQLAALNDAQLPALGALSMGELAGRLRQHLAALRTQLQGYGERVPAFRFHGGEPVAADLALGILLAELLVHGFDIARALARPWPIDPRHVELIFQGLDLIAPGWVNPARARRLTATFEVRLRGQATHVYAFRDGHLQVNLARPHRADVRISADPAAFLLVLYRRQPQWRHIAAGRLTAWGRKPWLAPTLVGRFQQP
jgi:SCP-2 sterol transfer family